MKKLIFMVIILGLVTGAVFAADGYAVDSVRGRVEKEVSPGKWEAVSPGSMVFANTVINVGLNSRLVIKEGTKAVTIDTMGKNTVQNLISAASGGAGGVKIAGKAVNTQTGTVSQSTSNISTASTRASDAAGDQEWAE
jgi:D-serine deaminase-like pyridoxal phosphate-dependent protein